MDGWIEDSIAIVDAYIASIAIRIMSETRDKEKDRNKDQRCVARHPRSKNNCKIYNTGNILNSIIPVLYQSTVYCNRHA